MCATNSIDHIFFEGWIEPGMHLSSIKRPEIEVAAIKRADRVVNIGLGYQFAAAGALVYRKARESGAGHHLPTDWFTEDVHP
jgi:hypothetical protein